MSRRRFRVHLSGPMSGLPDLNRGWFSRVKRVLGWRYGMKVFDPHCIPRRTPWKWAVLINLLWIAARAHGLIRLHGWEESPGARIESAFAESLRLPVWQVYAHNRNDGIGFGLRPQNPAAEAQARVVE